MRIQPILISGLLLFLYIGSFAQRLTFTDPVPITTNAKTDQAISMALFKDRYYIAYKAPGAPGNIMICQMGKHHDTVSVREIDPVNGQSAYAPVMISTADRMFIYWINTSGVICYISAANENDLRTGKIKTIQSSNDHGPVSGVNAAVSDNRLIVACITNTNEIFWGSVNDSVDKMNTIVNWQKFPFKNTVILPRVTAFNKLIRFTWTTAKNKLQFADLDPGNLAWSQPVSTSTATANAAIYQTEPGTDGYCFWKGLKNDNNIYYAALQANNPKQSIALPADFSDGGPPVLADADGNNFWLAFTGSDGLIYLSYFSVYDPAKWMEQTLMPYASSYTLKDIVIPGSHDAGMSVLSGTTGVQKGVMNNCNTLTQVQSISSQLNTGIRMFDLRAGLYNGELYARHSSSDCIGDAMGGGFGEKLRTVFESVRQFLLKNRKEIVLFTFSHFCPKELPPADLADSIIKYIGNELVYKPQNNTIDKIPLRELAGKIIISFDGAIAPQAGITSGSIGGSGTSFINFRREYAATNNLSTLIKQQGLFFDQLAKDPVRSNDLVRLDWQLTQSSDEAAMVCNDFQDESLNPAVNGALLLTNLLMKHKSITDLALKGNKSLVNNLQQWIQSGAINKKNKPNILYVDVAGAWITDYCIDLNRTQLYKK